MIKVYKMTNMIDGKIYVGKTAGTMFRRLALHKNSPKSAMYKHIKEFGIDNFKIELLQECVDDLQAREAERNWIISLRSFDSSIGHNISFGSKHNESTKQKIKNSMLKKTNIRRTNDKH